MFEPVKKIAFLCCLAAGFALLPAASSYAEINVNVQSAADYADSYGGEAGRSIAAMFRAENEGKIVCGRSGNICEKNQICVKVTKRDVSDATYWREYGYCLNYDHTSGDAILYDTFNLSQGGRRPLDSSDVVFKGGAISDSDGKVWFFGYCNPHKTSVRMAQKYGFDVEEANVSKDSDGKWMAPILCAPAKVEQMMESWMEREHTREGFYIFQEEVERNANEECFTDTQSNKKVCVKRLNDKIILNYGGSEEYKGCEVLPVKIYNMRGCFYCPLASLVFKAANEVTEGAFNVFGFAFKHVIAVVFVVWLALAALGQVFPMTKQDAPKFFAAILKQGFKFMVAFFLLANSGQLFSYFVSPLLQGGLEMGKGIQTVQGTDLSDADLERLLPKIKEVSPGNQYYNIGADLAKHGKGGLYYKIREYLIVLQSNLSVMQAIGTTLFCVGSHKMTFWGAVKISEDFLNGLRMMFLGGLLTCFAFILGLSFAFYFIDGLLQMAVIGAMMPLMIAGWPFKVTAQYASTGFKMLLNTFFVMFFTGFVVSVDLELVNQSLAYSQGVGAQQITSNSTQTDAGTKSKESAATGFNAIIEAANEQNWEKMKDATDIGGTGFLILAFCCIFGFKFVAQVAPLAGKLSAGGFSKGGIAGKIGTMAASSVKGMAMKAAQPVGQALADQYHDAGGLVGIVGDSAKTLGTVAGAVGSVAKEAGDKVAAKGDRMAAKGGFVGRAVGLALKEAGTVTGDIGSVAKGVGKGVAVAGGGVSKVSKKLHQPYRSK